MANKKWCPPGRRQWRRWAWAGQGHGGFAALDKPDGLPDSRAQIVIDHQARILAQARRRFGALLKMFARKRADNQPARAGQPSTVLPSVSGL